MNTCFPCVLRVSAPAEKHAMLFVSADFICVTRHCRSCCLLFLLLLLPTHAHTYLLCVCFPLPVTFCHRLPSPCVASRRSGCAITSIINPFSFQMARHAQRHSHYHSAFLFLFFPLSLSAFQSAPLELFRRRRQLAASVSPLFVFVFRLGHRLLLFAVCWPLCRTALRRTGQRHLSTLSLSPSLAAPWGHQRRQRQAVLVFSGLRGSLRCLQRLQIVFGSG